MEPPPKRLRILQSVEVDESSPGYLAAKQKQQERFKGTLESIFAKYGNLHESQSDEIDLQGNIVVNRGHLRRAARHGTLTESTLLHSVVGGTVPDIGEDSESEGEKGESEDELAPTQPARPSSVQKEKHSEKVVQPYRQSSPAIQAQTPNPVSSPMAQVVPYTPDPAANLLQHVQFPQTPAGQQAQSSFYAALTQTINHAVQQAVAPLFSSILPSMSNAQLPHANALPLPTTPANNTDAVTAARDPKWFFPPLPEQTREEVAARCLSTSRPIVSSPPPLEAKQHDQFVQEDIAAQRNLYEDKIDDPSTISVAALVRSQEPVEPESRETTRRSSPRVEVQQSSRRPRRAKYNFTEDEEIYIAKSRELQGRTWSEIKNSKKKWEDWPKHVFQQRYYKRFKVQQLHLKDTSKVQDLESVHDVSEAERDAFPSHHLPTPSSLEQEDSHDHVEDTITSTREHIFSSSTHYDEDERELLSLAGDDSADEQLQCESGAHDAFFLDANETVLPSVEGVGTVDEGFFQQILAEASPVKIKEEPAFSSPLNKRKRRKVDISYQALPDMESEADTNDDYNDHEPPLPASPSVDLVGDDDELQAETPVTSIIKREFSTPPTTSLLLRTPVPQSRLNHNLPSSGVKSASGLSKRAFRNTIKKKWAKTATPVGKTIAKRRSFPTVLTKRARALSGDSGDELGF